MKNLKKVLAMVLAFACTFTMFASAKMYEDVQPGTEFSEAITMLSDLGVIQGKTDNKYHPEDTITRAEACALIARLMTGDPNAAGFNGAHHFKDVPAGHWASSAIGYAVVNGIAVGVDQAGTKFEPNRPIKDKEFVTMIVRALGYETPDMRNNFPFGYMSAARAIGLLQDVNLVPDTDALRGEDAQVIYNAMFVDYARGAKRVNVAHGTTVEKYPTLAEDVWHLDRAAVGTWDKKDKDDENVTLSNCKAHTWVIVGQDGDDNILAYPIEDGNTEKDSHEIYESLEKDENGVKAAAYKFKYEGTGDIDALRGYKVELWGAGKHGAPSWDKKEGKYVFSNDWKIKAIKTIAGQTKFDYNASKADSKRDDGEIKVDEETTLKLGTAADNAKKVSEKNTSKTDRTTYLSKEEYNREKATSDKKVEAALNVRDGAQYRLMDWDGDKEIDWVVVSEASYYKVESVSSKRLTVTSMADVTKNKKNEEEETESLTQTWKIGDDNEIFTDKDKKNSYKVKYEVPEGLKEGDIIEVAYSTGWDKITGTVSVVESENHKLEKVATKNHLVLTFDGQVTELAENRNEADTIVPENPSKYIDFDEEELGRDFAIAKNRNGFIVYSDYATDSTNYLMVLDTDDGKNSVRGELGAMKILTSDNKVESNVEVVSDLMIDRKTSGNGYDKDSRRFDEHLVVGNVYRYWKDADGRITKMESAVDGKNDATQYTYVAKNDRLTLSNNESYALQDAKTIFAVKPHGGENGYIQHDGNDLKVDEDDVLAVKQADIPDIVANNETGDTKATILDTHATKESWLWPQYRQIAYKANNNKDIQGAILGVDNFNKFNAGSTKVGLVTNVSFDSNGVVSLDVATNGKTDAVSSAEKVKFEDIVSVKDYQNNKSVSVASRTETINAGIMKNNSLKDYLYKNGAYAEITTDKDGKLTGVLFMDQKTGNVDTDNTVVGNYYQVSRKVIADVKTGSWMSVVEGSAEYAGKDNKFKSLDTKNIQKASDFASDATYYVIDGTPTRKDKNYEGTKASILEGFDGTPDVKVGEASDIVKSEIRNNNNNGDSYNVADVASKIDAKGEGDIVAVYAYGDDMDEDENYTYVAPAKKFNVTNIEFAHKNGNKTGTELNTLTGHADQFVVYVSGTENKETRASAEGVVGLKKENFKVTFGSNGNQPVVTAVTPVDEKNMPGYYVIDLDINVETNRAVNVAVVKADKDDIIVEVANTVKVEDNTPVINGGEGSGETTPDTGSEASKNVKDIVVKVVGTNLVVTPKTAEGKPVSGLKATDFTVTVNGNEVKVKAQLTDATKNEWTLTAESGMSFVDQQNVVVHVGGYSETFDKVATTAKIEDANSGAYNYELGSGATLTIEKPSLINLVAADLQLEKEVTGVTYDEATGKIMVAPEAMNNLTVGKTLTFKLVSKTDVVTPAAELQYTITASNPTATVTGGKYDVTGEKANTLTLTLKQAATERVKAALENKDSWTVKQGNGSAFETNVPTIKTVSVTDTTVAITFDDASLKNTTFSSASEVEVKNTFGFNSKEVTFGTVVDTTESKIMLTKAATKLKVDEFEAQATEIVVDLGFTEEQAKDMAAKMTDASQFFTIYAGKNGNTNLAKQEAVVQAGTKLKIKVEGATLTENISVRIKFLGAEKYAPSEEVTVQVKAESDGISIANGGAITIDEPFADISNKQAAITVKGAVVANDLVISSGDSIQSSANTTAQDTTTGITAKVTTNGTKVELSGKPKMAGEAVFTVGSKDGKITAKVTVTVNQKTLESSAVSGTAGTAGQAKIKIAAGSAEAAKALEAELKAKNPIIKRYTKADKSTGEQVMKIAVADDAIKANGNNVEITVQEELTASTHFITVEWTGLTSFKNLAAADQATAIN